MPELSWETWLEQVPNNKVSGFSSMMADCAEDCTCGRCGIRTSDCVALIDGEQPRTWLREAYDMLCNCCLHEEEAAALLIHLYNQVMPGHVPPEQSFGGES